MCMGFTIVIFAVKLTAESNGAIAIKSWSTTLFRIADIFIQMSPQSVHWRNKYSRTPLHNVCMRTGDIQIAKSLIDAEADVNAK